MSNDDYYEAAAKGVAKRRQKHHEEWRKAHEEMKKRVENTPADKLDEAIDKAYWNANEQYNIAEKHREYKCYEAAEVADDYYELYDEEWGLLNKKKSQS